MSTRRTKIPRAGPFYPGKSGPGGPFLPEILVRRTKIPGGPKFP